MATGESRAQYQLIGGDVLLGVVEHTDDESDGKSVAYVGRLVFTLCNIGCGENDHSMTILK
jgi:hypothetical protein